MSHNDNNGLFRHIPSVDEVLKNPAVQSLLDKIPRVLVIDAVRGAAAQIRDDIKSGLLRTPPNTEPRNHLMLEAVTRAANMARLNNRPNLRRVLNLTGVVLHTNLGRAVLAKTARQAINEAASGYSNLELDLQTGKRGSRYAPVEELLTGLTGAEAALVVNNNAAAVLTLCPCTWRLRTR